MELQGVDTEREDSRGPSEARAGCRLGGSLVLAGQGWGKVSPGQGDEGPGREDSLGCEERAVGRGRLLDAGNGRAPVGLGVGGRLPRTQAGRAPRLRLRGGGAGRPTWAWSGAAGPGRAQPRRRGSALPVAAALAQAAAAARPPSCSGSPRGALPRQGGRSRAPARRGEGALLPLPCGAERKGGRVTRSPTSPSQSNKSPPQEGSRVWGTPFFQPKLWRCGSPQSPWEWGRGRTGSFLIGFELISSSQLPSLQPITVPQVAPLRF